MIGANTAAGMSAKPMPVIAIGVLLLSACTYNVHRVQVDTARLETGKPVGTLQCAYGPAEVLDARPAGDRAGGLGEHMLLLDDPTALITERLRTSGMGDGAVPGAVAVRISIKRFYLTQNTMSKVPVVVLQAGIGDAPPFLVRAQPVTMNWNGTENEAYAALANALQSAVAQLVTELNGRCPSRPPSSS